jgi:hypothetical protein
MTTEELLKALGRYTEESCESDRQTATKLGVKRMTLTAWLGGRDSASTVYAGEVSGFFETRWLFVGYGWFRLSAAL